MKPFSPKRSAFLFLFLFSPMLIAQGTLELFQGGIVGADLRIGSSGLSSLSGTFSGVGGSMSQLTPGGESVRWNPVGLAYIKSSVLYTEWVPPMDLDLNPVLDVESQANDKLHETVTDLNDDGGVEQQIEDFVIQPKLAMDGGQGNYAAIAKTKYFTVGGAIHSPTRFLADIGVSGTKFRAATEASGGGTTIRLLGILSGTFSTEARISGYSFAAATILPYNIGVGIGIDDYSATFSATGVFKPEAQVSSGSQEFVFNQSYDDPLANHYDKLNIVTDGLFKGDGARVRLGAGYHLNDMLACDIAFFAPYEIGFAGDMILDYNKILAFNFGAGSDENFFDATQLLEDDYTGTHKYITEISQLAFKFPGKLALAFAGQWKNGRAQITYEKYTSTYAMRYNYSTAEDSLGFLIHSVTGNRELGLEPHFALQAAAGAHWLQIRLGVVSADWINRHSRSEEETRASLWLPIFGLLGGFRAPIYEQFRFDYAFTLGVTSFVRFGISYDIL